MHKHSLQLQMIGCILTWPSIIAHASHFPSTELEIVNYNMEKEKLNTYKLQSLHMGAGHV